MGDVMSNSAMLEQILANQEILAGGVLRVLRQNKHIDSQLIEFRKEIYFMAKSLADLQAALSALSPKLNDIDSSLDAIEAYQADLGHDHDFTDEVNSVQALSDHVDAIKTKADSLSQEASESGGSDSNPPSGGDTSGDVNDGSTASVDGTPQPPAI